jgi:hypothetical protein
VSRGKIKKPKCNRSVGLSSAISLSFTYGLQQPHERGRIGRPVMQQRREPHVRDRGGPLSPRERAGQGSANSAAPESAELDAIEPNRRRELVAGRIEEHIDQKRLAVIRAAEESERELLLAWATQHEP